jgi:predicted dehydrogenase
MQKEKQYLNAGFIGVGNFISGNHLPNMAASKLWRIHHVCDIDQANLDRAVGRFKPAKWGTDYQKLLDDPDVDVVVLGVRHQDHMRFVEEIAAAGKHIFLEKPMSMSNEESARMIAAVQSAGVRLMVGYNRRFGPLYAAAKALFHKHHQGKRAMMTFRAVEDARLWPSWPLDPNDGGGMIVSECCHFFDFISWFLEAEPVRIFCEGYREDENLVTVRMSDGSIASIVSGGAGSVCYPKERLEVFADSTTLVVDQCLELHVEGYAGEADRIYPFKDDPFPDDNGQLTPVTAYRRKMRRWLENGIDEKEQERKAYYGSAPSVHKGHFQEIEALAQALLRGRPAPCDEIDGARATACCMAAVRSMEQGYQPVDVRPDDYQLHKKRR